MAPLRSLGNPISSFIDFYARTGFDAVTAAPPGVAFKVPLVEQSITMK